MGMIKLNDYIFKNVDEEHLDKFDVLIFDANNFCMRVYKFCVNTFFNGDKQRLMKTYYLNNNVKAITEMTESFCEFFKTHLMNAIFTHVYKYQPSIVDIVLDDKPKRYEIDVDDLNRMSSIFNIPCTDNVKNKVNINPKEREQHRRNMLNITTTQSTNILMENYIIIRIIRILISDVIREIHNKLNITVNGYISEYDADYTIANIATSYNSSSNILIISNDSDLFTLMDHDNIYIMGNRVNIISNFNRSRSSRVIKYISYNTRSVAKLLRKPFSNEIFVRLCSLAGNDYCKSTNLTFESLVNSNIISLFDIDEFDIIATKYLKTGELRKSYLLSIYILTNWKKFSSYTPVDMSIDCMKTINEMIKWRLSPSYYESKISTVKKS